jgi:hypothetical protein
MSSLTRIAPLTARVAAVRTTTPAFTAAGSRLISSTSKLEKGPVDAAKDTLKKADRTISDNLVNAIDKGGMCLSLPRAMMYADVMQRR